MNQNDNQNGLALFFGGVVAVIAIGAIALKAMQQFFIQLSVTFDAFGKSVESFFPMLLRILGMVGLVAGIVLVAVAAIYFTVKYVQMVRRATALVAQVDLRVTTELEQFKEQVEQRYVWKADRLDYRAGCIEKKLEELLKPATPTPVVVPEPVAEPIVEPSPEAPEIKEEPHVSVSQPY